MSRGHGLDDAEAREPPGHQVGEAVVAHTPRRAAEDRRVNGDAGAADRADLGPACGGGVPRLDTDHARIDAEQVVPRVETAIAFDRRVAHGDDLSDDRLLHQQPGQRRHVARAGNVPGCVEAVGADEVCVVEAELPRAPVHQRHEPGLAAVAHVVGERPGGVVRALDECRLDEVAHRDSLAGAQTDAGLADGRRIGRDRDHVAEPRTLERDQHGHHLRQARDRDPLAGVVREQHLSGASVLDEIRARVDARSSREGGRNEGECGRADEQAQLHGREG